MSDKVNPEVLAALIKLEMENERLHQQLQIYKDLYAEALLREAGVDDVDAS
jgi:hypothetical protein